MGTIGVGRRPRPKGAADLTTLPPRSIAVVFGTRPEIVKLAGIIELLGDRAWLVFSGQHFDKNLTDIFFDALGLPAPHIVLGVGGQSRAHQVGDVLTRLDEVFFADRPLAVVVQGDTNTVLGGSLAANAHDIPLAHVEAGLRSFDRRMPEEHNRVVADQLADLCLAPTAHAEGNLLDQGVAPERIAVTGNTVVDVAQRLLPEAAERSQLLARFDLTPARFVLATLHRPENVDDGSRLKVILEQLASLGAPVLLPVHPRTKARIEEFDLGPLAAQVCLIPPLGYQEFLGLAAESALLISDSGGVQEEASIVKRPVLVVRRSTERPEVLGTFAELLTSLDQIGPAARDRLARVDVLHASLAELPSPYGDGRASERCVEHIARVAGASAAE